MLHKNDKETSQMKILVTGAANGIGAAITAAAAARGHTVIATDLNGAALSRQWKGNRSVLCEALDVTSAADWEALMGYLDRSSHAIDVLVNVAGVLRSGKAGELKPQDVHSMIDVNVKGVIFGTNAVAPGMIRRRAGHIINIGSIASLYATPGTTVYAASKFAVRGFTIAAAGDLRPHGVAVTLFGPGPVKTRMLEQQRGDIDAALTFSVRRAFSPEEVADAVLGPVLKDRPLEYYLPGSEGILGKISNVLPGLFLSQIDSARKRGQRNFSSSAF
jgi:3-oxoacyl-[acyl-carrier protein] reductase